MTHSAQKPPGLTSYGPWLVALGAALWGTETAWRVPLQTLFGASVIVFWEHAIQVLIFIPFLFLCIKEFRNIPKKAYGYLLFSGIAGSAIGTLFFTKALWLANKSVVNVLLNLQPIFSTTVACLLFKDRLSKGFFLWASLAMAAGVVLCIDPAIFTQNAEKISEFWQGIGCVLICAICWGLSTVAGRGATLSMSPPLATSLRVIVGLLSMSLILAAQGSLTSPMLWPSVAREHVVRNIGFFLLLSTLSGGIPTLIYFWGMRHTRASTAGYFEMAQTLAGAAISWMVFNDKLKIHQILAGCILLFAVTMLQRAQRAVES